MENKVSGKKSEFAPVREDASRVIVSYGFNAIDEENATWNEIYFYKKQHAQVSFADIKQAIIADIDARTVERITSGFVWTPLAEGAEPINVWLSTENQLNFKAAYDLAVQKQGSTLPVTFKLGEQEDGTPVYHTFETMEEADDFYTKAVAYVNQTLAEGWAVKDAVDWTPFKPATETKE